MDTQRSCRRWRVPSPPDLDPVPRRLPDPEEYGDRFHDALRKEREELMSLISQLDYSQPEAAGFHQYLRKQCWQNARKTLSRSAKTPEGATTRSKAVPNKNNKSILKGKTSVEDEPEESEDEEPEAAEEELPTQKDRDPAVKQVPTTAVPRSVQKRVEFEVLPEGGLPMRAKPTKSGMIPFVDIPPMNPALRQKKPVATNQSRYLPLIRKDQRISIALQ